MPEVACQHCGATFFIYPSVIVKGGGKYCSVECKNTAWREAELRRCVVCGKEVYRRQVDIRKSKAELFFCNRSCRVIWTNQLHGGEKHPNWKGGTSVYRLILLRSGAVPICARCGTDDVRVLAVHHLDGDRSNNDVENLSWLCHNCHHLIHHYPDERARFDAGRPIPKELRRPADG